MNTIWRKRIISTLILVISLSLLGYFIIKKDIAVMTVKNKEPWIFVGIIIANLLHFVAHGKLLTLILKKLDIYIKRGEGFGLTISTRMWNYITPFKGGFFARAIYLKKVYGCNYVDFLSTYSATFIVNFLTFSSLGTLILLYEYYNTGTFYFIITTIFMGTVIGLLVLFRMHNFIKRYDYPLLQKAYKAVNGWYLLGDDVKTKFKIIMASFFLFAVNITVFHLIFYSLGYHVEMYKLFVLAALNPYLNIVGITPAGLGIREGLVLLASRFIDMSPEVILPFMIHRRFYVIIIVALMGPIYSVYYSRVLMQYTTGEEETPAVS